MANGRIVTDEVSTTNLINAFAQAADDQAAAQQQVGGAGAELAEFWTGDASNSYGGGLAEWQAGLTKVQQALSSISDSMVRFARDTASTEDDNLLQARLTPASALTGAISAIPATPASASWT
ncbi:hypothetical protein HH310_29875 [Actinoplanes sp. TBRC 11911]|uniref:WXG100 family type VII secretion target n=1 Tax=Actinoplanes sp. TBRC 11911 TaxID=2729386 RepID=UPI00145D4AFE|nr:WXG100 family type VII secretion target [Actinoplanes sp. TBRC 11911]NMO55379.1 hypothetical protein [Actinoplanes sp. TBRC 11911]